MATGDLEYSFDKEIAQFFDKTTVTRAACDAYAAEHLGGDVIPVAVQGVCSYTVYAGPNGEFVTQFRLRFLELNMETANLARTIYGHFAPNVAFKGHIGEDMEGKEPVYIYVMDRIRGISYLDFMLAHNNRIPENSGFLLCRGMPHKLLLKPTEMDSAINIRKNFGYCYLSTPPRFCQFIQESLDSLQAILSLPMVLLHKDFGVYNVIVDETSCNLTGVVDWAEAEIAPFGLNLHSLQRFISKFHLERGWIRYNDYVILEEIFWTTFLKEVGELDDETISVVKLARVMGLLLSCGFTSRLANEPVPAPIQDNENGAYNMRVLDGLLINPDTRFTELT